jgi:hypothetical protein
MTHEKWDYDCGLGLGVCCPRTKRKCVPYGFELAQLNQARYATSVHAALQATCSAAKTYGKKHAILSCVAARTSGKGSREGDLLLLDLN